jgi:hypothetical protein
LEFSAQADWISAWFHNFCPHIRAKGVPGIEKISILHINICFYLIKFLEAAAY